MSFEKIEKLKSFTALPITWYPQGVRGTCHVSKNVSLT